MSYWFLSTAGRFEVAESLYTKLDESLDVLVANMPPEFEGQCAGLDTITPQTLKSSFPSPYYGDLVWTCHNYWMLLERTMDGERIKHKFFPLLKKSVNMYCYIMEEGEDGRLHLPLLKNPEYGEARDTNFNLALFRWGCKTLVSICDRYHIDDELLPKWHDILTRLVDYPVNENGYMVGANFPYEASHRHYSHLLMFYPLQDVSFEQEENRELIEKSVSHWINYPGSGNCGYSWSGAAAMYALMGDGEKAAHYIDTFLHMHELNPNNPSRMHSTTWYTEGQRNYGVTETPFSLCDSLQSMVLQGGAGIIRVFPAIPKAWQNISFAKLLAQGGFEVSAAREGGLTKFVHIKSLAGEPCRLRTDLQSPIKADGGSGADVETAPDGTLIIDLAEGEDITLYSAAACSPPVIAPVKAHPEKQNSFGLKEKRKMQ
jgi:alpha-L-fucosidase 2